MDQVRGAARGLGIKHEGRSPHTALVGHSKGEVMVLHGNDVLTHVVTCMAQGTPEWIIRVRLSRDIQINK